MPPITVANAAMEPEAYRLASERLSEFIRIAYNSSADSQQVTNPEERQKNPKCDETLAGHYKIRVEWIKKTR